MILEAFALIAVVERNPEKEEGSVRRQPVQLVQQDLNWHSRTIQTQPIVPLATTPKLSKEV